jgi:hypothetical protein
MRQPLDIPTTTRAEVLRAAEVLQREAMHLKSHAGRCTDEVAPAHAEALRRARGRVRAVIDTGQAGEVNKP